jgi:capsular polysaccharide biosynthesis protein
MHLQEVNSKLIHEDDFACNGIILPYDSPSKFKNSIELARSSASPLLHEVYELNDVAIFGGWGYIPTISDLTEYRKLGWSRDHVNYAENMYGGKTAENLRMIDGEYLFLSWPGIFTYGHWIYDLLPRIYLYKKLVGKNIDLILPHNIHSNLYELLDLLQIGYVKIDFERGVRFRNLYVPSFTSYGIQYPISFHRECYDDLFKNVKREPSQGLSYYLQHITQSSINQPRVLSNEDDLLRELTEKSSIINPGNISMAEQFKVFSGKKRIAGVDSSALHNLILCDQGSEQLVISSEKRINYLHLNISALKDTDLYLDESDSNLDAIRANVEFFRNFMLTSA